MVTATNCQDSVKIVLADPELGKQYLLSALNSGDRQKFISALREVMDAILEESK